ncbi:MAG: hypothetical protein M9936_02490 [Caldilinea sp.]|nr:hypothetical protein [Caldilineaceae bacterium]MCO5208535.1 hypothetical protein [Caldilinea sp.]
MWRLTTEEIALLLSLTGRPELAQSFLLEEIDSSLTQIQVRERLMSATHSLLASQHAAVTSDGRILLEADMAVIADVLVHVPYSLRLTRTYHNAEFNQTYHWGERQIIAHWLEQGVVHCFEFVDDLPAVAKVATEFFVDGASTSDGEASLLLDDAVFQQIMTLTDNQDLQRQLNGVSFSDSGAAEMFAVDVIRPKFRGSVLLVRYPTDNPPIANDGFLLLAGENRLWLIEPNQDQHQVALTSIGASTLEMKIQAVLHKISVPAVF